MCTYQITRDIYTAHPLAASSTLKSFIVSFRAFIFASFVVFLYMFRASCTLPLVVVNKSQSILFDVGLVSVVAVVVAVVLCWNPSREHVYTYGTRMHRLMMHTSHSIIYHQAASINRWNCTGALQTTPCVRKRRYKILHHCTYINAALVQRRRHCTNLPVRL